MKKVYLFLAVLGFSAPVFSQTFDVQLFDYSGNNLTNGVYAIPNVDASASETDVKFIIQNNGSNPVTVRVMRENVQMPAGYTNSICFGQLCFPASQDSPQQSITVNPSGSRDSSFHGTFFNGQGTTGDLCTTYRVFDANDESQYVTVRVYYGTCLTAAVTENSIETINLSAYPNPASGSVLVKYNLASEGQLIITDITGKTMKNIRLNNGSNATQVDISDLRAGVYIYSIQAGNKRIISKKLIVR